VRRAGVLSSAKLRGRSIAAAACAKPVNSSLTPGAGPYAWSNLHEVPRSMHIVAAVTVFAWPAGEAAAAHLWRARARRRLRSGPDVVRRRDLNGARKGSSCARTLAGTLALFHRFRRSRLLRTPV